VLTTGGATPWAICHGCAKTDGNSLRRGWWVVLGWLVKPMALLLVVYLLLRWLIDVQ
jgi:hypothetical protein